MVPMSIKVVLNAMRKLGGSRLVSFSGRWYRVMVYTYIERDYGIWDRSASSYIAGPTLTYPTSLLDYSISPRQ